MPPEGWFIYGHHKWLTDTIHESDLLEAQDMVV